MDREIIRPENEAAWLELRKSDITSTMSPALFDLSPYQTAFEVYHSKKSGLDLPFEADDRMRKGSRMQDYAADEVARKHGWTIWRMDEYIRIPGERIGSSFDYRINCPKRGQGILEVKGVDYFRHKELWVDDQAPEHIEIQFQHQCEFADKYDWGMIVAFTSIYDWHEYPRERDREMGAAIRRKIAEFWADVDAGNEPRPDFSRDGDMIKALHKGGPVLDRMADIEFNALLSRFKRLGEEKKEAEEEYKATQAEIIMRLGNHSEAFGDRYKFKVTMIKDNPGQVVTDDMVGTVINAKRGYPRCTISDLHKGRTS